jgi:NitT/TauT family transport system substrate-binding protein
MRSWRARAVALIAAVGALMLVGCSSDGPAAAPPRVEKPDLTVAVVPALDSAGFFIALYDGLFTAQGLNVHFVPAVSSETAISAQVKGTYDITGGNYVSYIQAQQDHAADLDIFAEGSIMEPGAQAVYTLPGSPIKQLSDLVGKTIGINAPDNILYLLVASVLADHGISVRDVHFKYFPLPQLAAELKAGAIDAAVLPEPFASDAEEADGAVPLVDLDQGATTNFPVQGYVVTKQWARRYPRTLAAFDRALEQGQEIADTNRSAVEHAMEAVRPASLAVSPQTAAVMALDSYPVASGPTGSVDLTRLKRVVDVMQQFIGFDRSFTIGSMLVNG